MISYDSTFDTQSHIIQVRNLMFYMIHNLILRSHDHDWSKLQEPEKSIFDEFTPKLKGLTYGSPEYKQALLDMGPALEHHYAENHHHPEHFREVADPEIDEINAYLEDIQEDNPVHAWLTAYRDELQSRVNGMSLLDVLEMLADWKAAGMRHADGSLAQSLEINHKRFKISDQLQQILINTAEELGWI